MENEYLAGPGSLIFYIVIIVAGWLYKLYKKQQEKERENQRGTFIDDEPQTTYTSPSSQRSFEEVLEEFSGSLKRNLHSSVEPEPTPAPETMVNSLEELQSKYGAETIVEEEPTSKRFDHYKIKKEKKNIFADMLDDTDNFKKAFILSEILDRKYK